LSDEAVLALLPASLAVGGEMLALDRIPDSGKPMSAEEVEDLGHFLPGIDTAVLACVRFVSGMVRVADGYQLVWMTAYAAPNGSPVSGADLAEAAKRRYTESTQIECVDAGSFPADLLCGEAGAPIAFSSAGYVAFDVGLPTQKTGIDPRALAATLAAGG
jgi:hypothetical protein